MKPWSLPQTTSEQACLPTKAGLQDIAWKHILISRHPDSFRDRV